MRSERATYTVSELAVRLGVSTATIYEQLKENKIPHLRMGTRYVIPRAAIEKWLEAAGTPQPAATFTHGLTYRA